MSHHCFSKLRKGDSPVSLYLFLQIVQLLLFVTFRDVLSNQNVENAVISPDGKILITSTL